MGRRTLSWRSDRADFGLLGNDVMLSKTAYWWFWVFLCLNPCFHWEINIISNNSKIKHNIVWYQQFESFKELIRCSQGKNPSNTIEISHLALLHINKKRNIIITKKKCNQRVVVRLACFMLNKKEKWNQQISIMPGTFQFKR